MLSPDKVKLLSVNAAPFLNSRSTSAADGMMKSYNEIANIMKLVDPNANIPYYKGSEQFLADKNMPVESEAVDNIINTVMNSDERIYKKGYSTPPKSFPLPQRPTKSRAYTTPRHLSELTKRPQQQGADRYQPKNSSALP